MYNNNILSLNNLRVQKNIHKKHSDILLLNNLTVPEQIKNAVYYYEIINIKIVVAIAIEKF